jgi:tetratricopeptide (TPR) repeat protein
LAFNKEKVMDAARKFVDKGQIDKAVKEYLRIVSEDPKDVRVWLKIGDLYAKKGAKQDATDTYLKVARFYHEQGFFLKAVAVYKQILKLDPRLVDVIMKLAELYRQLGHMSDAMQHYESVAAHFHREGNTKQALETVKQLVDLDPENIATRIKLAELYSKEGVVEDAVREFTSACDQLRRQGRQDDFVKVAERLLWHKPDNHELNRELAGLYLRRNDPRRALQKLQACFKADPRDVETLGLLAQAFQALDQKAKTVSVLKELARIHVENKQRDIAGSVYRKILEFVPNDQDALQFVQANPNAGVAPTPRTNPPAQRSSTPLPKEVRAAGAEAKFAITSDLPAIPESAKMTGSLPLVDEQSLSGVDFALPEYDDGDFSADMEPPPDPRRASAVAERHAEEIAKILAETDVYVKYGLHQKAVDHLRRVFAFDPDNVEAHERLKDIFISQAREHEAEIELLKLAEIVAPSDPDRAEQYLQELLAMNGTHTGAFELARRFRLRVARAGSSSASVEVEYGGVAEIDELDDLDLAVAPPTATSLARHKNNHDNHDPIDDFDPNDLIGARVAHGSPTPQRPPMRPGGIGEEGDFALEFSPPSQATAQISPERQHELAQIDPDAFDDPVNDAPGQWGNTTAQGGYDHQMYSDAALDNAIVHDAVESQLDDDALGQEIDHEVAAELGAHPQDEEFAFDPAEARAFDAARPVVSGYEETDLPIMPVDQHFEETSDLAVAGGYDPYGTEQAHDAAVFAINSETSTVTPTTNSARPETLHEEDLEEADFYASQGMYAEALDNLRGLVEHYPTHPLLQAKIRDIEALWRSVSTPPSGTVDPAPTPLEQDVAGDAASGTDAIELEDLEEVASDELVEVDADELRDAEPKKRGPSVLLEKPVDESDADTHYDLGLAYKEMGLYDEAVKAFEKVARAPGREVQCRVMLGMCQREQGNPSEAIHQFKQGLHAEPSERERLSLYYEIGMTYEAIGDNGEALYYFEAVTKRDAGFADAASRAERLRSKGGHATRPPDDDL